MYVSKSKITGVLLIKLSSTLGVREKIGLGTLTYEEKKFLLRP